MADHQVHILIGGRIERKRGPIVSAENGARRSLGIQGLGRGQRERALERPLTVGNRGDGRREGGLGGEKAKVDKSTIV